MCSTAHFEIRIKISSVYRSTGGIKHLLMNSNSCKMFSLPKLLKDGYEIRGCNELVLILTQSQVCHIIVRVDDCFSIIITKNCIKFGTEKKDKCLNCIRKLRWAYVGRVGKQLERMVGQAQFPFDRIVDNSL